MFHLDSINDHLAGDGHLINFAHLLKKHLRQMDVIGRLGRDGFTVLAPQTATHPVQECPGKLRALLGHSLPASIALRPPTPMIAALTTFSRMSTGRTAELVHGLPSPSEGQTKTPSSTFRGLTWPNL